MKIIEMQRLTDNGQPVYEEEGNTRDWWCVIETKEEELIYDDFVKNLGEYSGDSQDILWNKLIIHAGQGMGVCWGDDDMYGYFRPDDTEPEVGEEYVDGDGDTWKRVY